MMNNPGQTLNRVLHLFLQSLENYSRLSWIITIYYKLDQWIMQSDSFHWLGHHVGYEPLSCPMKYGGRALNFLSVSFLLLC